MPMRCQCPLSPAAWHRQGLCPGCLDGHLHPLPALSPAPRGWLKSHLLFPALGWPWHQRPPRRHRPQRGECKCSRWQSHPQPLSRSPFKGENIPVLFGTILCPSTLAQSRAGAFLSLPSLSPRLPEPFSPSWRCQTEQPFPLSQGLPGIDGKDGTPGIPGVKVSRCGQGLLASGADTGCSSSWC